MTELQFKILDILAASKVPALSALEISKIMEVSVGRIGSPLGSMRSKYNLGCVYMARSDGKKTLVPGRVLSKYTGGMIEIVERKRHWFLKKRRKEVDKLKRERHECNARNYL